MFVVENQPWNAGIEDGVFWLQYGVGNLRKIYQEFVKEKLRLGVRGPTPNCLKASYTQFQHFLRNQISFYPHLVGYPLLVLAWRRCQNSKN
jgi:hypothetical protein